ncbi:hypothetical protein BP6252_10467 [Coleophoma cylindrospora]|uniref:Modin n=1 Tax=Coleophoma cylindrospora TaxID=1849047 RepID=A0A3D8QSL1_9HELO|nr:hypothetical protein BP6252_10467 [Coleophoma cylindrospora]
MGLNSLNQNVLTLVALVVSLVALLTTVLQVLQQYFSSADGYRRCAESVMGKWAEGTHRKLRAFEFRVEVVFETPVIFVAPPSNDKGPIPGRPIHYIDGTDLSYENTRVLRKSEQTEVDLQTAKQVHTADDERASWLTLLSTLQQKELESRAWDEKQRDLGPAKPGHSKDINPPEYGIACCLQSKTRSWDFMPSSITKPYATSAICHLVEIMAMVGMYWKAFDQSFWNLRAEGNGHILTATEVHGLGVMVNFAVSGKAVFKENRVIPSEDIKDLCFGFVSDIFTTMGYQAKHPDAQSLNLLFGRPEDVRNTLESLGCSADLVKKYEKDHKHIFSVSFEIVAMLSQVVRIRGSSFRMIPNPTEDFWLKIIDPKKPSWKMTRLMEIFQAKLRKYMSTEDLSTNTQLKRIIQDWDSVKEVDECKDDLSLCIRAREAIHDAIDNVDKYLLEEVDQALILGVLVAHLKAVMDELDNPESVLNSIVLANKEAPLVNFYFNEIFPTVIKSKVNATDRSPLYKAGNEQADLHSSRVDGGTRHPRDPTKQERERRSEVWLTLVFRMFCWLLLHDFDHKDAKIVPSDLRGSRMPVFIG